MLLSRRELESIETQTLASYAVKNADSKGRQVEEEKDWYRMDFQRDRDRVIHSHAFRRLKDKTQVFVSHYGDHYRNRLTHTLEVAQLSRDIARNLGVNEDLAETIALAHDLGHTPFGHAGEETLNTLLQKFNLSFEHNEQSKRIVTKLEKKGQVFPGLNLTWEVLDGISKHQTIYDQSGKQIKPGLSIEAQIVNICDEIAYQNHDLDDGARASLLDIKQLGKLAIFKKIEKFTLSDLSSEQTFRLSLNKVIKLMVNDLYQQTEKNIQAYGIKTMADVYQCPRPIVYFSEEMQIMNKELRHVLYDQFYSHPQVREQSEKGQKIIEFLFNLYLKTPPVALGEKAKEMNDPLVIVIKDYIAGMTDAYAEKQFNKILYP